MSAELELAVEAEVVEALDQAAASRIDQRIRLLVGTINDNIVKLRELVDKAKRGHVHLNTVDLFQGLEPKIGFERLFSLVELSRTRS
ncbi:MAG: hypothetical protein QOG80_1280 [Pseudonocardiales bacterium]|jgi:ABC-type protease/lipase transport system fused ATPase/permease subunit|nr:hypothetical protein [Pseudonocardiales bacterium]